MIDERHQTRIPAEFLADGWQGRGEVRNVSQGGLFVRTQEAIPDAGTEIKVTLTSPGKVPVEVQGFVWWTAPPGQALPCGFAMRVLDDDEGYKRLVESL